MIQVIKAVRRQAREEEIKSHGKQISFRRLVTKNPKAYNRNQMKNVDSDFGSYLFYR